MARSWSCKLALGVGVALFLGVCVLPTLAVVGSSLGDTEPSLALYRSALGTRQVVLLGRSVALAAGAAGIALLIGVPIGLLVSRTDLPARRALWLLCLAPLIVPPYINAVAWVELLGERGLISRALGQAFGVEAIAFPIYSLAGGAWAMGASLWPLVALLSAAAFRAVDGASEDSARLDGNQWAVVRRVTLPLAGPLIAVGALFVFLLAVTELGTPDLLRLKVYTTELYANFVGSFDTAAAGASCTPLLGAAVLTVAVTWAVASRSPISPLVGERTPLTDFRLGRWRVPTCALVAAAMIVTVGLPIGALAARAGGIGTYGAAIVGSVSQCTSSLWYALWGATAGTVLALPMSYLVTRSRSRWRWLLACAALAPVAVPGVVTGIGLAESWNASALASWLPRTGLALPGGLVWEVDWRALVMPIGCAARFAPFAVGAIVAALLQVDRSYEEAAAVAGASWWQGMRHVVLPLIKRGALAGWAVVFILSMREVAVSILVYPPGRDTVAIRLFQMMHYGADAQVAALGIILIAMTLAVVAIAARPILAAED